MFGLEISAGWVQTVVGGAIGAGFTLLVGWLSTKRIREDLRENVDVLVTVARGLEEAFQSGELEFNYDDEGRPAGIVVHLSGTAVGGGSAHATLTVGEDAESDEGEG